MRRFIRVVTKVVDRGLRGYLECSLFSSFQGIDCCIRIKVKFRCKHWYSICHFCSFIEWTSFGIHWWFIVSFFHQSISSRWKTVAWRANVALKIDWTTRRWICPTHTKSPRCIHRMIQKRWQQVRLQDRGKMHDHPEQASLEVISPRCIYQQENDDQQQRKQQQQLHRL